MAYHGMSYEEALEVTPVEFQYLSEARRLVKQDEVKSQHEQAWLNEQVGAQKKVGKEYKAVYPSFKDFYDTEEEYKKALFGETENTKAKRDKMKKIAEESKHMTDFDYIEEQNRQIEDMINKQ